MTESFRLPHGMHRPTFALIDLAALGRNLREIRQRLKPQTRVCAVVKADAYGHGAVAVSLELERLGVESLVVATVEEGIELREAGVRMPVLVLAAGGPGIEAATRHGLTLVIYSEESARCVQEAAAKVGKQIAVHFKLDTGMGRIGLPEDRWKPVLEEILANPRIRLEGILSHFSSAPTDPVFCGIQMERFSSILSEVRGLKAGDVPQIHMANSAGIVLPGLSIGNMVRPGITLYGAYPDKGLTEKITLDPVMSFKTRVLCVKSLPSGSPVSYGQTFRAKRPSRIATLPVGYADGYCRDLSNRGVVLIRGKRVPVAGIVTMDMTMVDVTDEPDVCEGDEVTLFGYSTEGMLRVDEVADWIGRIPYELLCGISKRVPRIYARS